MTVRTGYVYNVSDIEAEFLRLASCRESFRDYVAATVLNRPGYVHGKHIDALCDFAQKVADGEIRRGIVVMPPRHSKSTVMEALVSWYMFRHPQRSLIVASYGDSHAYKLSSAVQTQTSSKEHVRIFPTPGWASRNIQDMMLEGKVDGRPNVIFRGVGSGITGSGADLAIIDDPIKDMEAARSITIRDKTDDWFKSVLMTRLTPDASVLIVLTRWHHDDLVGRILDENPGLWDVLHMPAIDDHGNALWPERFTVETLEARRKEVGSRIFEALYQGRPTPTEGDVFRRSWFKTAPDTLSSTAVRCRYWDCAATEGGGDWTVGVLMAKQGTQFRIEDVVRIQGTPAEVQKLVINTAEADGRKVRIRMEEEGGSSGKYQTQTYARLLVGYNFRGDRKTGSKQGRADPMAAAFENGMLDLAAAPWNRNFITELCEFPSGAHDDQVDAASGAFEELTKAASGPGVWVL